MKENITLLELLERDFFEFKLSKKIKIFIIKSPSRTDRLMAEVEEFHISEIPYRLLRKKVYKVYYYKNTIEVFDFLKKD